MIFKEMVVNSEMGVFLDNENYPNENEIFENIIKEVFI